MALHTLSDDGQLQWICPHCNSKRGAHISHAQVEYLSDPGMVALPPCDCGSRTAVRTAFTEQELRGSNMTDEEGNPTESHAIAHRHIALARQLQAAGKVYTPPQEPEQQAADQPVFTLDQVKEIVTQALQEHGVITSPRLPSIEQPNKTNKG